MGRPPLPLGAHGSIDFHDDRSSGRVRARARFRDFDGRCRAVTRWGASREEATDRLETALADRAAFPARDWAGGTTVAAAASFWQADLDAGAPAAGTRQLYRAATRLYVQPALGGVRLCELAPAVIDRALAAVRMRHGPQPARTARRALSSLCADAVRHGAIRRNPVIDSRPIGCPHRPVRALSAGEAIDLQLRLRADSWANRVDLPDLVQFMLGAGVRIGKGAAGRDAVVDHAAGNVLINATVVRIAGVGLQIRPRTKTAASERVLALPEPVLDPSNTQADLRAALNRLGYP